jgi:hypothetical protein
MLSASTSILWASIFRTRSCTGSCTMSNAWGDTVLPIKAMASGTAQCACTSTVLTRRPPRTTGRRQGRCRLRQTTTHKHDVSHGADLILEELPLSARRLLSA